MYRSPDQRDKNDKLGETAPSTRRGLGLPIRGRCGTYPLSWRINALGAAIASVAGFHCSVVTLFLSEPRLLVRSTAAFGLIALRLIFAPLLRLPRLIISPLLVLPLLIATMLLFASHPRIIFIERFRQHAPPTNYAVDCQWTLWSWKRSFNCLPPMTVITQSTGSGTVETDVPDRRKTYAFWVLASTDYRNAPKCPFAAPVERCPMVREYEGVEGKQHRRIEVNCRATSGTGRRLGIARCRAGEPVRKDEGETEHTGR